jgi:hypothetical protein
MARDVGARIAARRHAGSFGKTREAETSAVLRQVFWPAQREQGPNLSNAKGGRKLAQQGRRFPGLVKTPPMSETSGGKPQSNYDSGAFLNCPLRPNSRFLAITQK